MFGWWIDGEIQKAQDGAKTNAEAEQRVKMLFRRIFASETTEEGAPPPPGTFRDPAARFN